MKNTWLSIWMDASTCKCYESVCVYKSYLKCHWSLITIFDISTLKKAPLKKEIQNQLIVSKKIPRNLSIVFYHKLLWYHKFIRILRKRTLCFRFDIAEKFYFNFVYRKMQGMLHNLKSISMRWIGVFGANADQQTNVLQKPVFFRKFVNCVTELIRCWHCGNENSTAGIQFKCIKCQSLLELPNDVVNFHFKWILRTNWQ